MKKDWILIDRDGFGTSSWEETSTLYWCGGDYFAIVWERSAFGQMPMDSIEFYNAFQVKEAWKKECSIYDYDRANA